MANKKISAFTEITEAPDSADVLPIVDVSDTTGASTGTTKKVSLTNLSAGIVDISTSQLDAASLVTESDGISSNDNDTTLPTSAAVKDYVDAQILTKDNLDEIAEGTTNKHFTATDETKLDGIEDSADVTDTANVTAAGALMDSELTDLAGVKGVTISTLQEKPSEGAFVDGDKTKLDGIETSATADQTDAEIRTAVGNATDSNVFTDADHSKLDGIATAATANDTDANLKDRANHTGTQAASTITSFATEVANTSAVTANTAKETNATHTGDVTGSTALTIADDAVQTAKIADDAVTTAKIVDDAVTGAKLNAALNDLSNVNASPSDGQVLKWDGDSSVWQAGDDAGAAGGISEISEDTTPQLGGDLDVAGNKIVSASNGDIVLSPDGTGKVGIGATPKRQISLHESAAGSCKIQITNATTGIVNDGAGFQLGIGSDGTANIEQRENEDLVFHTNNNPRLRILAGGSVGIGGTPAGERLEIINTGASTAPALRITNATQSWNLATRGDESDNFVIRDVTGGSNVFTLEAGTGMCGINTLNPSETLTLNSASNTRLLLQEGGSSKGQIAGGGGGLYIQNLTGDILFRNSSENDTITIEDDGTLDLKSEKLKLNGSGGSADQVLKTDGSGNVSWSGGPAEIGIACSDETSALSTGEKATVMVPKGMTIKEVKASLTEAGSSSSVVVNIMYHASNPNSATTSLFATSNALTIASGAYKANILLFTDGSGSTQDTYTADEDSFLVVEIPSSYTPDSAARGLKVWVLGEWS